MRRGFLGIAALGAMVGLGGCATIVDGTTQQIAIATNPPGARCRIDRDNMLIGDVSTPGSAKIHKSADDILVTCGKLGYQTATVARSSHFTYATLGNIVAGGIIGVAVDGASGANYKYPRQVFMALAPALPDALSTSPVAMAPTASGYGPALLPYQPAEPPNPFRPEPE